MSSDNESKGEKPKDEQKVGDIPSPKKIEEALDKKSRHQRFQKGTEVTK